MKMKKNLQSYFFPFFIVVSSEKFPQVINQCQLLKKLFIIRQIMEEEQLLSKHYILLIFFLNFN